MPDIEYSLTGKIATLQFNRPESKNAITYEMLIDIERIAADVRADDAVRALIVTGTGTVFSAGTDLKQVSAQPPAMARAEGLARAYPPEAGAPWTFPSINKPVIAAVNGAAIGLGVEFTLQCDLRIAARSARFGWVFVHRGIVPDTGAGTWLLSRIVGLQNAAYLLYSGEIIDAAKALALGYVMEVVDDDRLPERAQEIAEAVSRGSPSAVAAAKRLLYRGLTRDAMDHLVDHTATLSKLFAGGDFAEGARAFLEKRPPKWLEE